MALIVAFLPHVAHSQRLRAAVKGRHDVIHCTDWSTVFSECDENPVQIAVIDLHAEGSVRFDQIRRLRAMHPRMTLIAYVIPSIEHARDLFDAGRYGFDGLIVADQDDTPAAITARISQAESRGVIADVRRVIGDNVPAAAKDVVLVTVSRAYERLSAESLARLIGTSRRMLARMLAEAGLPNAGRLVTWGRLIVAAHLLEDPARNADGVSRMLRFPSGSAFRNTCQRYLHAAPNEIRAQGGSEFVIGRFRKELDECEKGVRV